VVCPGGPDAHEEMRVALFAAAPKKTRAIIYPAGANPLFAYNPSLSHAPSPALALAVIHMSSITDIARERFTEMRV
jgi:hypothetical protein